MAMSSVPAQQRQEARRYREESSFTKQLIAASLLVSLIAATGCSNAENTAEGTDTSTVRPPTSAPPTTSERPTASEPPSTSQPRTGQTQLAIPAALVGSWVSSGGDAELNIEFDESGNYLYAGLLAGGSIVFTFTAAGTATADANVLTLHPSEGEESLRDSNAPQRNYDRPINTVPQKFDLRLDGNALELTDAAGVTISYERE